MRGFSRITEEFVVKASAILSPNPCFLTIFAALKKWQLMLDTVTNKVHDEARQGEAFAPFANEVNRF